MNLSETLANTRPSEGLHWYDISGKPCYEVIAKGTGLPRPTTLRDAKVLNLCPSVSAIIKCAAAPALNMWMQEQVLLAALTTSRRDGEAEGDYIRRIMADSREQGLKARDKGVAIHAASQGHYEGIAPSEEYLPMAKATSIAVRSHFGERETWTTEKSFAHVMGFGGKCDLVIPDGPEPVVIDFKTKDFDEAKMKNGLAWEEHAMQLIAYAWGFDIPHARCANVFVSRTTPGLVHVHEWKPDELKKAWAMFRGLLAYWQAKSNYAPNFDTQAAS